MESDIGETANRAGDQPELVRRLGALLIGWLKETGADMPRSKEGEREAPLPALPGG